MAHKTLLNSVNEVLKRVSVIEGQTGLLTTLVDSPRQTYIDTAVQAWNEAMDELYSVSERAKPLQLVETTLTLVDGDRDYALAADLVQLHFPLLDETNGQYISEVDYESLVNNQSFPANYTGLPQLAAIRPTDGQLYLDRIPTANEAGKVYKYRYNKDTIMDEAADTVPFNDAVFRALVPAVVELWKMEQRKEFNEGHYRLSIGRAARLLSGTVSRNSYLPSRVVMTSDPYA